MNAGVIGGILGCVVGVMGGVLGTYATIRNTQGPRERLFTVKASIIGWLTRALFLSGILFLPDPYRFFVWVPYAILFPIGIHTWNKKQTEIREEESTGSP